MSIQPGTDIMFYNMTHICPPRSLGYIWQVHISISFKNGYLGTHEKWGATVMSHNLDS